MTSAVHHPHAPGLLEPRLLPPAGTGPELAAHLARCGPLPHRPADQLLDAVRRSGLTGRGGAGFPLHRKLRAVGAGRRPVVVANAGEGEPCSRKDSTLLTRAPHLVLDGLQAAAAAVGAHRAVLYTPAGPGQAAARRALAERRVGRSQGADRLPVELLTAPPGFVSGQESAVVRAVDGGPALPRSTSVPVYERGVGGRATLVSNVETLAHLALVARWGPDWFREAGTAAEPGTMLCTVSGIDAPPTVVEVPLGAALDDVLTAGGQDRGRLRGLLVGGYHGTWLSGTDATGRHLSREGLAPNGASPGAGVLIALDQQHCPLAVSARIVSYLAGSSARQCGPCLNGLPALADTLTVLAGRSWSAGTRDRLIHLTQLVDGRGACHHPDGTVRLVRSVLTAFPDEIAAHADGRCSAGAA